MKMQLVINFNLPEGVEPSTVKAQTRTLIAQAMAGYNHSRKLVPGDEGTARGYTQKLLELGEITEPAISDTTTYYQERSAVAEAIRSGALNGVKVFEDQPTRKYVSPEELEAIHVVQRLLGVNHPLFHMLEDMNFDDGEGIEVSPVEEVYEDDGYMTRVTIKTRWESNLEQITDFAQSRNMIREYQSCYHEHDCCGHTYCRGTRIKQIDSKTWELVTTYRQNI